MGVLVETSFHYGVTLILKVFPEWILYIFYNFELLLFSRVIKHLTYEQHVQNSCNPEINKLHKMICTNFKL